MEVILIRHAQTAGNTEFRYIGSTDQQLCTEGVQTARAVRFLPEADKVYVSPMIRARQTAEILFPGAKQTVCDGFREMDFGAFEGKTAGEMKSDAEYAKWLDSFCQTPCPGGESIRQFSDRVCAEFERIAVKEISSGGGRMVIVAHGGTIMAVMSRFARPAKPYFEWGVPNCCGYAAKLNENAWYKRPELTDIRRLG